MNKEIVHILNGNALRKALPQSIIGKRIICREALIQGRIKAEIDDDFWEKRSKFICENYSVNQAYYEEKSKQELLKIGKISRDARVYLWFEHDAFCQIHLFFVAKLLVERKFSGKAFLVLPQIAKNEIETWRGFGNHTEEMLEKCLSDCCILAPSELALLAVSWNLFAEKNWKSLCKKYIDVQNILPFAQPVSKALAQMNEVSSGLTFIENAIIQIQEDIQSTLFLEVFEHFSLQQGIYGFADLQLKNVLKNIPINKAVLFRNAKSTESETLSNIAFAAKAHWNYPNEWLELWKNELTISESDIINNHFYVLEYQGVPIAVSGISCMAEKAEIMHFWVLPAYIGKGLGRILLQKTISSCLKKSQVLEVVSDPNAQDFYLKMGFTLEKHIPGLPEGRLLPFLKMTL